MRLCPLGSGVIGYGCECGFLLLIFFKSIRGWLSSPEWVQNEQQPHREADLCASDKQFHNKSDLKFCPLDFL